MNKKRLENGRQVSVYMPEELRARLLLVAKAQDRSIAAIVRIAIENFLREVETIPQG